MKFPFLELKPAYLELKDEFDAAYHRVMDSGWYLLGHPRSGKQRLPEHRRQGLAPGAA